MSSVPEQSVRELADAAFVQAARKAIELAKQTGTPIITRQNGSVVKLDPHTMKPIPKE